MIVGIAGRAGSGKTTVADYLIKHHDFSRRKFADPLKNMLRRVGLTDREIEGEGKHQPCDLLCGRTPRHAMQTLGTEWGRNLIHPDLWVTLWAASFDKFDNVVSDDVRFTNEAAKIRELGGITIQLVRPDALPLDDSHASEVIDFRCDFLVYNDSSIEHLCAEVARIVLTTPMKVA